MPKIQFGKIFPCMMYVTLSLCMYDSLDILCVYGIMFMMIGLPFSQYTEYAQVNEVLYWQLVFIYSNSLWCSPPLLADC